MNKHERFNAIVRNDFYFFVQRAFKTLNPGTEFMDNWHLEAICYELARCWRGEIKRLIITVPPRYGKSICTSIAFPAFILGHDPSQRIIVTSYGSTLSAELSNSTRGLMKAPWYRSAFPGTIIDPAKDTEELFRTTQGGQRIATSVGGAITGMGGNWIILDDPIKAKVAASETDLKAVIDYYAGTLYSRLDDKKNGCIILIMQRTHEEDLAGYLMRQEGWTHLNLPAIAQTNEDIWLNDDEVYPRTAGEALHPEREPLSELKQIKEQLGPHAFAAQYQQCPIPLGGGIVEWEWFKTYKELPNNGQGGFIVQSWDTAMDTHASNSYSVCTTWFCFQGCYYLMHVWRQRLKSPDLLIMMHKLALEYQADLVVIEQHNGSQALIEMLLRHTLLNIGWVRPKESKIQRMVGECAAIAGGKVFLPAQASWLAEFRSELVKFPQAKHDDQVDSVSQFLYSRRVVGPNHPTGGGVPGRGLPNGPVGPPPQPVGSVSHSRVTPIYSDPPDLDFSELYS